MPKSNKPILSRAISDGVFNKRIVRMCKFTEHYDRNVTVLPAKKFVDFLKGMEVLNQQYVQAGIAQNNRTSFLYNEGLLDAESALFLARKGDEVLGTISVIAGRNQDMPCMKLFSQEIRSLNLHQRKVVEVGTLAVKKHPDSANIVLRLYLKIMLFAIFAEQVDDIFIQVKDDVSPFYIRNFLFSAVGLPKKHPDYCNINASLLRVDVRLLRKKIVEQQIYGPQGWLKIICELGLYEDFKSVCNECAANDRFSPDEKDAEVYKYLCSR